MKINDDLKRRTFSKTDGICYYCNGPLALCNHGRREKRGAWHIDHKNPRAKGGSDDMKNLAPACIPCNEDKSDTSAVSYRRLTKPVRIERRNKAIQKDLKDGGALLVGIISLGLWRIAEWWKKKKEREEQERLQPAPSSKVRVIDLPWDGIIILGIVIFIVFLIFRARRVT